MKIKDLNEVSPQLRERIQRQLDAENPDNVVTIQKIELHPSKRIRQSSKQPSKLEVRFRAEILNPKFVDGFIDNIKEQAVTFKLGNGVRYTPDFIAWKSSKQMICYEVKGKHAFDGALDKLKIAAAIYKDVEWQLWWFAEGEWKSQLVLP